LKYHRKIHWRLHPHHIKGKTFSSPTWSGKKSIFLEYI